MSRLVTSYIKPVLFVTVALCIIGGFLVRSFPVAIFPDVTFPRLVVIAEAGDRPIKVVESAVSRPLEESLATVSGVSRIRSKIQRGAAEISVDFAWGTDMMLAMQVANAKVNEARSLMPPDAKVTLERMNPTVFPILGISLRSKKLSQTDLWNLANYTLRPRLSRVSGVARVVVQGGRVPEIAVEVTPQKMAAFKISLSDINLALAQTNTVRNTGRMDKQFQQVQVMVSGQTESMDDLANVVVANRNGIPITLGQVAEIKPSTQDRTTIVTADGEESVLLNVVRQPEANTVSAVAGVKLELDRLKGSLPAGTELGVFYDQSILIGEAISSVRDAVLIGSLLSIVVLLLFLGNLRATLTTAVIIPSTVLITFLLMRLAGLTLNLMTLGALAVGIGLVIDDAIVVVENVFRHLATGQSPSDSVKSASSEIMAPMVSSTLTTVVVFLPLMLASGVAGAFFTALAITLTIALMVSLGLALVVSPTLCAAFLRVRPGAPEHGRLFEKLLRIYEKNLRFALNHRWLLPVGAAFLLVATVWMGTRLGTGFMPAMDEGAFVLDYWTPPGTSLTESDRLMRQIEDVLKETPEIANFSRRTGTEMGFAITEPNRGDFAVMLKPKRKRNIEKVIDDVRSRVAEAVPGVDVDFIQTLQDLIGDLSGSPSPVEIKLFGEDPETLERAAKSIGDKLAKIKGVADMKSGIIETEPELTAKIDPIRAGRAGLTADMVATQVNAAMFGETPTTLLQGERQIAVRVRYPEAYRTSQALLALLPIRSPQNFTTTLAAVSAISQLSGAPERNHENQRRMIAVTSQLSGRDLGSVMTDVQQMMRKEALPAGVTYILGGLFESQNDSFSNLLMVLAVAILLVFTVMLFQFGSFTAPLSLLAIMPLALFGVTLGLWVTKTPFNVSSFMGAIMLVGIVVKNGILLLDQAQKAERSGSSPFDSALHAGESRLRPILMTTLTAILGLVPLAMGLGAGAEMQKPLAIAVIGGLTFSTLITLFFAPMLYVTLRNWQVGRTHRSAEPL